ncbi:ThiF family adenylyltransferase [Pseudomonas resinovorans]|uniref:ThiF family adenylyltransferase n=1 Tax=Metapseudomonas resinovorans TaxID=53412 RepID=A0ABT4Y4B5_METRE|nr:ThiF family adenylyltransferase [Pseudomonas resinovorans]MDA8483679.1 ThiF family adenylyltransferase [Pseudomonas resinovorans]
MSIHSDIHEYCAGTATGPRYLVTPSTFYTTIGDKLHVSGPKGTVKLLENTPDAILEGLLNSGSLIPGSESDIDEVVSLLKKPETSRTASYLLCSATCCRDVIQDFKALCKARVLIVGCGGVGSTATMLLAGSGIRYFKIIDADIIEKSNLNRQLFWRSNDIGKYKTDVLATALKERFKDVSVEIKREYLSTSEIGECVTAGFDGVIVTADNPPTLARDCEELSRTHKTPIASGGYLHNICIANFFSGEHPAIETKNTSFPINAKNWQRLPNSVMPSFGPSNFLLASILSSSIISAIAKQSLRNVDQSIINWNANELPTVFHTHKIWPPQDEMHIL